jgi:hypothetical protein
MSAAPAIILLAAAIAVAPQLIRGNSCGHDFDVHLVSWLDCVNAWKHGILYPHWTPNPNYGAGEPRFVFYPPLTWMLGAALGLVMPWWLAPIALTFLILAATGLATRALALEACDDAVATLAGCAAIFSGFALFTAYERSAFPEFTGGFWLPLILLFALRARATAPRSILSRFFSRKGGTPETPTNVHPTVTWSRAFDGSTVPLALVLAGAWLSNPPLGVIASYLLAAVALLWALLNKSWAPVLRAAVATILGMGLTATYLLPAALERRWVDIRQAFDDPGYNFENSWLFARHANPALQLHDVVLRTASWIAVSMIAVAIAGLAESWRRGTLSVQKATESRRWWIPLAAIPFVVIFLLFPLSRPVWNLLPEWHFLQYPWRWLEAVEAPMAIFFAAAVWPSSRRRRRAVAAACVAAFVAATVYAATTFFQVCYPEDTVASTLAAYRSGTGFEGMYEYEPPEADAALIPAGLPDACLVSDPSAILGKQDENGNLVWSAAQGSCEAVFAGTPQAAEGDPEHRRIFAAVPHAGYLVLRLLSYPAWRVQVNGLPVPALPRREDGLIAVPVPPGAINLTLDWITTPDAAAGRWVSGASLLLLIGLYVLERRRSGRRQQLPAGPRLS